MNASKNFLLASGLQSEKILLSPVNIEFKELSTLGSCYQFYHPPLLSLGQKGQKERILKLQMNCKTFGSLNHFSVLVFIEN